MNKKSKYFRGRNIAIGCVAIPVFIATLAFFRPKHVDLLQVAKQIDTADSWSFSSDENANTKWYSWFSESQVVYLNQKGELTRDYVRTNQNEDHPKHPQPIGILFDKRSDDAQSLQIGPKKNRILYPHYKKENSDHAWHYDSIVLFDIDEGTNKTVEAVDEPESLCFWGNDAFLELVRTPTAHRVDLYEIKQQVSKKSELLLPGGIYQVYEPRFERNYPLDARLLGVTANDTAVIAWWDASLMPAITHSKVFPQIRFVTVNLKSKTADMQVYSISMPAGAEVDDICLSPSGDKLAWQLHFNRSFPVSMFNRSTTEIWISSLSGDAFHRIVTVEEGALLESFTDHMLLSIRWMPDGKNISFIRQDYNADYQEFHYPLYSIPAH